MMNLPSTAQTNYKLVHFATEDAGETHAAYFAAGKAKAVVFAHGAVFSKESWYGLAETFQDQGVTALSIDFRGYGDSHKGSSDEKYHDIVAAVAYLQELGYKEIDLIGGSMGGAAILRALSEKPGLPIAKVVLLAPAGGPPVASSSIKKLIIVSKKEGLYPRVKAIYEESAEPRALKVYEGSAHAQHMFKEAYAGELRQRILGFIL